MSRDGDTSEDDAGEQVEDLDKLLSSSSPDLCESSDDDDDDDSDSDVESSESIPNLRADVDVTISIVQLNPVASSVINLYHI